MRAFTTKGGQIFEVWENRKEALHDVADIIDGIRYVKYKWRRCRSPWKYCG